MQYENFYIIAPVGMLNIPLPLKDFQKKDEDGELVVDSYMTIPEYLLTLETPHTVERFNNDNTKFCKGFAFNLDGLHELEQSVGAFGLTVGEDILMLSPGQIKEELAKNEWQNKQEV